MNTYPIDPENELRNEYLSRALGDFERHWKGRANTHWCGVFKRAQAIFVACEVGNDFCLQSVGEAPIFGGFNRLFWDKRKNEFRASDRHCTPKFLERFAMLKSEGKV